MTQRQDKAFVPPRDAPLATTGASMPASLRGRRFVDAVPQWLFWARRRRHGSAVVAVVVTAAVVLPLWLSQSPSAIRPGSVFVLAMLVAGLLGGYRSAAAASVMLTAGFFYLVVPPERTLDVAETASWGGVAAMALAGVVVTLLAGFAEAAVDRAALFDRLHRDALATERRARRAAEKAEAESATIAGILSGALLPARLPAVPGFTADAWLLPARSGVAGDFYDLFVVRSGWVAVMGDVQGKGAEAAAVTSLARYTARAAALVDPDPVHVATVVHEALVLDSSDRFVTMAVVRCELGDTGTLHVTLAGQPQPRLLTGAGVQLLGTHGSPLGLWETVSPEVTTHPIHEGDTLVLFTDGLLDRTDEWTDVDFDCMLETFAPSDPSSVAAGLRQFVTDTPPAHVDDIAVLAIARD